MSTDKVVRGTLCWPGSPCFFLHSVLPSEWCTLLLCVPWRHSQAVSLHSASSLTYSICYSTHTAHPFPLSSQKCSCDGHFVLMEPMLMTPLCSQRNALLSGCQPSFFLKHCTPQILLSYICLVSIISSVSSRVPVMWHHLASLHWKQGLGLHPHLHLLSFLFYDLLKKWSIFIQSQALTLLICMFN